MILHLFALEIHISPRRGHVRLRGDQEPELMSDVNTIKPHRYCRSQALLDQSVSADVLRTHTVFGIAGPRVNHFGI